MSLRYNESYICPLKFVLAPLCQIFQKSAHLRNHQVINLLIFRRTLLRCFDTQFCGILADTLAAWGVREWRGGEIWLGEDYGGEAEGFEELLELGLA